jgi:cytochrome P450
VLHEHLRVLTLRVILATVLGRQAARGSHLVERVLSMLSISTGAALTLAATRRVPSVHGRWQRFLRQRAEVDRILLGLIDARRRDGGPHDDALSLLVDARDADGLPLTDDYIRDSIMSLVLAGHETTSAELAWAFQLVAHDRRVQHELATEIRQGGGSRYLRATVSEVLRHRPVFLFAIPRAVQSPITIGGWTHTPPSHLLVCLYLLHRDPQLFAEPQAFKPERFLDEAPGVDWMPWAAGASSASAGDSRRSNSKPSCTPS